KGKKDGAYPVAGVMMDKAGNLYGTASAGGSGCGKNGCGVVFMLSPSGAETVLHAFAGSDGDGPGTGVIIDKAGNVYGATGSGGADDDGVIYRLAPDGTETVLHSFTDGTDGNNPRGGLVEDEIGNLYGTTRIGGVGGNGTV